jgi:AI-2 transport protein TqsA
MSHDNRQFRALPEESTSPNPPVAATSFVDGRRDPALSPGKRPAGEDEPSLERFSGGPARLLLPLALVALLIYAMHVAAGLLTPILLALFATLGLSPILHWLQRRGMPAWMAVAVVLLIFIVLGVILLVTMAALLTQVQDELPVYQRELGLKLAGIQAWLRSRGIDSTGLTSGVLEAAKIVQFAAGLIARALSSLRIVAVTMLVVVFMAAEAYSLPRRLGQSVVTRDTLKRSFSNFSRVTSSFLFIRTWFGMFVAVILTLVYYAFGVDFPIAWGVLFFFLHFVPTIGFVLAVTPVFLITWLDFDLLRAAVLMTVVIAVSWIVNSLISNRLTYRRVGISSVVIFISLLLWTWVFGTMGTIMSIPLTLMVRLLFFESYESTLHLSQLMARPVRRRRGLRRRKGHVTADS